MEVRDSLQRLVLRAGSQVAGGILDGQDDALQMPSEIGRKAERLAPVPDRLP